MQAVDWGLVPYQEAATRQLQLVEKILAGEESGQLVFCTHPPVVTLGRGTKPGDVFGWRGETLETPRGGRATYHGPSQIVAYPVLPIESRDLHAYMRVLESAIVDTLKEFGISAEARTVKADKETPSLTGVWVGERKIASIGIAVKKWIAYHGLALNVTHDVQAFTGINPCGFQKEVMTSMEQVLGPQAPDFRMRVQATLERFLSSGLEALSAPSSFVKPSK